MRISVVILLMFMGQSVSADECPCDAYPFEPNPPCYSQCVKFLIENSDIKLSQIKNLDPGVAISVSILRRDDFERFANIEKIMNKENLEAEAVKVIPDRGGLFLEM